MAARAGRSAVAAVAAAAALAAALAARSCSSPARDGAAGTRTAAPEGVRERAAAPQGAALEDARGEPWPAGAPVDAAIAGPLPSPSVGWEDAAEALAADLRRLLDGRPGAGAYAEARAEAARADLALFPPGRDEVRRLLAGGERERILALAALAARPDLDDDLLRLVLRSQRPDDDEVVRLLGAEIAAAAPAGLAARHEDALLRAFEREPNPLVLAVALPALERMEEGRLRALLRAQAAAAAPEMLPILLALARDRLGASAVEDVRAAVAEAVGAPR